MVTKLVYLVFVLPVIVSVAFGSVVMADVLQSSDRELNLWRFGSASELSTNNHAIDIIGLEKQYLISNPIEIQVQVNDVFFDCGDLYITILSEDTVITQSGFFKQCFTQNNTVLPIDDEFSKIIDTPGKYDIIVEINDQNQKRTVTTSGKFTVK